MSIRERASQAEGLVSRGSKGRNKLDMWRNKKEVIEKVDSEIPSWVHYSGSATASKSSISDSFLLQTVVLMLATF